MERTDDTTADVMDWYEQPSPRPMARVEIDTGAARRNLRSIAERSGRAMDNEEEDSFERLRTEGYM